MSRPARAVLLALAQAAVAPATAAPTADGTQPSATQAPTGTAATVQVDRLSDEHAGKGLDIGPLAHSPAGASPYLGPAEAPVVVNVFTDFQCPVCKRAADPIKQLAVDFPGQVKVVVRNSAPPAHPRSQAVALAALAAGNQGKYWQYYDRLWEDPHARDDISLEVIARALELDIERWKKDVSDPANAARVREESDAAIRLGAEGTPAFFVNGARQVGWGSFRDLRRSVEREIAAGAALATSGAAPGAIAEARIRATATKNAQREGEAVPNVDDWVNVLLAP